MDRTISIKDCPVCEAKYSVESDETYERCFKCNYSRFIENVENVNELDLKEQALEDLSAVIQNLKAYLEGSGSLGQAELRTLYRILQTIDQDLTLK